MKHILFICVSMLVGYIVSCDTSKNVVHNEVNNPVSPELKKNAFLKFENDTIFSYSPKKSYVLCQKSIPENNMNPNILTEFFVYDLTSKKVIYEDKISSSHVSWYSDYELLIVQQKGTIVSPDDSGKISYLYNLKLLKKTSKKEKAITR
ncbi:MAG: hypothetical protein L3J35_08405 [Bacteroidales bacterium]|nr:hypothetical protein [Bacteroidales bacterium]